MKAAYKPRTVEGDRVVLEDVLPLETPLLISLDPSSACNFKCIFCYHSGSKKVLSQFMSFELYKKCIDNLQGFDDIVKTVRLYKEGEPLLNKNIVDMVRYAKNSKKVGRVDFTTNGSLLDSQKGKSLVSAGLDKLIVSIEGLSSEKYFEMTGMKQDFQTLYQQMKSFYKNRGSCVFYIKTTDLCVPKDQEAKFFELFGDICDEIFIEQVSPFWPDFDLANIKSEFTQNTHGKAINKCIVCPSIFNAMIINADGTADVCFADWERKCLIGNANNQSLHEIWHGEKINNIRILHLEKGRNFHSLCKNCQCPDFTAVDNIDQHIDVILTRFKKRYEMSNQ